MCTIMTLTNRMYDDRARERIQLDARSNNDGFALLLADDKCNIVTQLRTMDITNIFSLLENTKWSRMFLHCRMATTRVVNTGATHGWQEGRHYYMHNGVLWDNEAYNYDVDSMLIGQWIREKGVIGTLNELRGEDYANVFIISPEDKCYYVSRSRTNSLYTDGKGNYSTNVVGVINQPVGTFSSEVHAISPGWDMKQKFLAEFDAKVLEDGVATGYASSVSYRGQSRSSDYYDSWDDFQNYGGGHADDDWRTTLYKDTNTPIDGINGNRRVSHEDYDNVAELIMAYLAGDLGDSEYEARKMIIKATGVTGFWDSKADMWVPVDPNVDQDTWSLFMIYLDADMIEESYGNVV